MQDCNIFTVSALEIMSIMPYQQSLTVCRKNGIFSLHRCKGVLPDNNACKLTS